MEEMWNVYAWNVKHSRKAVQVAHHVDVIKAADMVDAYLNRGLDWDAYMVEVSDDPGDDSD